SKAADEAEDPAKRVGALPGGGERGDAAGTGPGYGAVIGIVRELVLCADLGQNLVQQKPCVPVARAVVFVAAVEAGLLFVGGGGKHAGIDHDGDRHRHGALVDQVVKDDRHAPSPGFTGVSTAVLEDHDAGGLRSV